MELIFKIFEGSDSVFYYGDAVENDLNYRGEWDFYGDYMVGNIVKLNGVYYIGNADSSLNQLLPTRYHQDWLLLNIGTVIEEPIGFDSFKSKIERGSEHGISAEVSVDSLGFYGAAAELIRTAYNADIDSELVFRVEMKCSDTDVFSEIYRGMIDLSTYEDNMSDSCIVSCKVGEIGVRTTFNNRVETILNLHNGVMKNLDGVDLVSREIAKEVVIPSKGILFRSSYIQEANLTATVIGSIPSRTFMAQNRFRIYLGFDTQVLNEHDSSSNSIKLVDCTDNIIPVSDMNAGYAGITVNDVVNKSMGFTLDFDLNADIKVKSTVNTMSYDTAALHIHIKYKDEPLLQLSTPTNLFYFYTNTANYRVTNVAYDKQYIIEDRCSSDIEYVFYSIFCQDSSLSTGNVPGYDIEFTVNSGSIKLQSLSIVAASNCDLALTHETLSRATEVISGLTVKSDWYGRFNSGVNPLGAGMVGGGALKGLVKGLRLRNGDTNRINPTVINSSFKDLYLGLKAIDNIGWGFSEEGGELFIRVENWKWFYKNEVILTINHPKEKTRKLDEKEVYSRLKIGYAKYAAVEDINSVDTFHTERNYSSGLKAIDHEMSQLCKFIADPYAIEFTRRKSFDKDTKDWKYDENIFVFALKYGPGGTVVNGNTIVTDLTEYYNVDSGVTGSGDTMISPETMINFRISPFRNACKFTDIVKQGNLTKVYNLTSGVGNVTAKGEPITVAGTYYLQDPAERNLVVENDPLFLQNDPILKPETLEFEYPLTVEEYNYVRANPYGKIVVDGEVCYLKKIEYARLEGSASFTLIPTFDQ